MSDKPGHHSRCNARARAEADFDLAVAQDEFVKVFEAGTKV